jgi:hypothetical protein
MPGTIWLGGEDLSFQQSSSPPTVFTGAGSFRAGLSRCSLQQPMADYAKGDQFAGGAVTSAWISAWLLFSDKYNVGPFFGAGQFSSRNALLVGTSTSNNLPGKVALFTYDGTTLTQLAEESGTSLGIDLLKIDMQVINYGATATVNIYVNRSLVLTFTGDVTVSGMTDFDCLVIAPYSAGNSGFSVYLSEFMVDTRDTRTMNLWTQYPTANGGTDGFTGDYTDCDPVVINDANAVYTDVASEDEQFELSGAPSGTFTVLACLIAARACITAGSPIETLKLGWYLSSVVKVDSGHTLTTGENCYERLSQLSPFSGLPWTADEVENQQSEMQSAT